MARPRSFASLTFVSLLAALTLSKPAAAEPNARASDIECLADGARAKSKLGEQDRRRADLAMMYYMGRLSARMSEVEIAAQIDQLPQRTAEEQAALRRGCAANLMTSMIFMAPVNKALADVVKR